MAPESSTRELRAPLADEIPDRVWHRSGGPTRGTVIRYYAAFLLVGAGFFMPRTSPVFWVLVVLGVCVGVFTPLVVRKILTRIQEKNAGVSSGDAASTLRALEDRKYLLPFAPHAWLALQRARLSARAGNYRAAAKAYEEVARVTREEETPRLFGAWADALLCGGDRPAARKLLEKINADQRSDRERLNWVVAHLLDGRSHADDLAELESCTSLEGQARYAAALHFARLRAGAGEAEELDKGGGDDPLASELAKRARKLTRRDAKSKGRKKGRKKERASAGPEAKPEASEKSQPQTKPKSKPEKKRDKKQSKAARKRARREARREEKVRERQAARLAAEARELEAHEKAVSERERAVTMARARKAAQERLAAAGATKAGSASKPKSAGLRPASPRAASAALGAPKVPSAASKMPSAASKMPSAAPKVPSVGSTGKPPASSAGKVPKVPPPPSLDDLFAPPKGPTGPAPLVPPVPKLGQVPPAPPLGGAKGPAVPGPSPGGSKAVDDDWAAMLGSAPVTPKKK